ncbi:hypothetical protein EMPG_12418 [Blastomyces silverae]|uniref:Uncharacterized protein n=1 Tax=Blastomyces silverae TaxID=2060906 RepID=A0A0H1BN59_9EURO|nr:hypothetical protein EMPG_12418 [Blastomyces silverae]
MREVALGKSFARNIAEVAKNNTARFLLRKADLLRHAEGNTAETMGPKKVSKTLKSGAASSPSERSATSIAKKALALEKLFQSLSQEERDALLHMSDGEEETREEEAEGETDSEVEDEGGELGFRTEGGSGIFDPSNVGLCIRPGADGLPTLTPYPSTYEVETQEKGKAVAPRRRSARLHGSAADESTEGPHGRSSKGQEGSKTVTRKLITPFAKLKKSWPSTRRFSDDDKDMNAEGGAQEDVAEAVGDEEPQAEQEGTDAEELSPTEEDKKRWRASRKQHGTLGDDVSGKLGRKKNVEGDQVPWPHSVPRMRRLHYDDKTDLRFHKDGKPARPSVSIMRDPTVEGLPDAVSIIERLAGRSEEMPFVDREFFVLPSQRLIKELGQLPARRKLRWRLNNDGLITPRTVDPKGSANRDVVILQTRGEVAPVPCRSCAKGIGWFEECVVAPPDDKRTRQGHGACANCQWGNKGSRCSLNRRSRYGLGRNADNLLFGGSVPGFEKAAAMGGDADDIGEASDADEGDDSTNAPTEGTPTPSKRKALGQVAPKPVKRVRISEGGVVSTPEKAVEEALMSGGRRSSILSSGGRTIDSRARDLKVLGRPANLDKHNLDAIQAARKELDKIAEFANVVAAAGDTVADNRFFKLPSGARFGDLVDGGLGADVAFWDARLAGQEVKLQEELEDDW